MADAEKPLDPSSQTGRDRFGKESRRTLAWPIASTRRAQGTFLARGAEGQKRNDVGIRQRGIGTVAEGELAGAAGKIDGNGVLADGGGRFNIQIGIDLERISEIDVAAGQREIISAERHLAAE